MPFYSQAGGCNLVIILVPTWLACKIVSRFRVNWREFFCVDAFFFNFFFPGMVLVVVT